MTYGAFLIGHPLFWSAVAGIALGAGVAFATLRVRSARRREQARSRKWTAAALCATAAVLAVTCGVLIPDPKEFLRIESLYVAIGAFVFAGLALRFPRAGGIPALLVIGVVAVLGPFVVKSFVPVRDSGVVGIVRLLAADESGAYVEVKDLTPGSDDASRVIVTARPLVRANVRWLDISDYLFFLGARAGLALEAVGSEAPDPATAGSAQAPSPAGGVDGQSEPERPAFGDRFMMWIVDVLPLLELREVESDATRLGLLKPYDIVGLPDGTLRIRPSAATE